MRSEKRTRQNNKIVKKEKIIKKSVGVYVNNCPMYTFGSYFYFLFLFPNKKGIKTKYDIQAERNSSICFNQKLSASNHGRLPREEAQSPPDGRQGGA